MRRGKQHSRHAYGSAFAGETMATSSSGKTSVSTQERHCRGKSAGTEGAYYHSNFWRNAVILCNDTPNYMTFFVYCGDMRAPNDINELIHNGAQVYEIVVPPHKTSYTDQRARYYWVGSKRGKWGIDMARNRIVPS